MAPRSLPDTDSARAAGSAALSQSNSSVPRNRAGDAPIPVTPMSGMAESCTPARLRMMPVCAGQRPDRIVAWPGAVSVIAWSWDASQPLLHARQQAELVLIGAVAHERRVRGEQQGGTEWQ